MKYNNEFHLITVEDVQSFFKHLTSERKVNFHPDEPFEQYVDIDTHEPTFTEKECELYNRLMDEAFEICDKSNVDIYSIGLSHLRNSFNL